MAPLRVLEVSKSTGGLGTYIRWLARGIDQTRFSLTFACLSSDAAELAEELALLPGVRAMSWPMNRYQINPFTDAIVIWQLWRVIRAGGFDIVHAHGSKAGFIARLAALGNRVAVIYSPHNFAFNAGVSRWRANLYAFVERLAARWLTAKIITVSDGEQSLAFRFGVGVPDLFVTVHSGADVTAFSNNVDKRAQKITLGLPPQATLIGAVGRLSEQKAPLDFVRLAARIRATHPNVHFVWAGDGPLEREARDLCVSLGCEDTLQFLGQRSDVPAILSALDIFVMTSRWEAFPIALLEAMGCGVPVVATRLAGIAEAVEEGKSGMLLPLDDLDGMTAAIASLLADPDLMIKMGEFAQQRVARDFTREQMLNKLMNVYESVAKKHATARTA